MEEVGELGAPLAVGVSVGLTVGEREGLTVGVGVGLTVGVGVGLTVWFVGASASCCALACNGADKDTNTSNDRAIACFRKIVAPPV